MHKNKARSSSLSTARRVLSVCIGFSILSPQWANRGGLY